MVMTVQPLEPVSHRLQIDGHIGPAFPGQPLPFRFFTKSVQAFHVTLANGQKIIVRAKR